MDHLSPMVMPAGDIPTPSCLRVCQADVSHDGGMARGDDSATWGLPA
jgi:hypothetical protein